MIHALVAILAGLAAPCALAIPIARSDGSMATIVVSKDGGNATFGPQYNYMIEDINNSIDGGWYAEMLQNRAFQVVDPANQTTALYGWQALDGTITVTNSTSPVSTALPNSLKVTVPSTFENLGYWGMKIDSSWTYDLSFWAKAKAGSSLTVTASLESTTNPVSFGSATFSNLTTEWTEYTAKMTPSENGCNLNNTLRFKVEGDASEVDFALFSLFPPTYKGRKNGARIDITEAVAATHPSGLRFPGGNNIEGQVISQRWIWNNTIGPLVDRPGRMGDWSYPNDDGMGLMEYLDLIEDLGIEGIMGVWAGYALEGETVNATDLGPYVQTAIDQIEFAIGAADTTYGKMRADLGHPEPYNVPYVEIGNEDFFASKSYVDYRWAAFHDAIQARFPDLKILATTYPETKLSPEPKYLDAHVYQTPEWFFENKNLYDNYNRSSFKIFEGEYAVTGTNESCLYGDVSCGRLRWSTMEAACGEAAFMTGLERNSDLVFAAAYAPMLENINRHQWSPNLIGFDAGNVYLSASYYIQKLFSVYRGDSVLPFTIEENLPAGTNSSLAVVVSHASDEDKTFVKLVNFGNATRSVTLDFTAFSTESTSVSIDYVVASNGVRTAANVPGQEVLVQNQVMQTTTDKGMLVYEMPAWSVAVVNSCFRND